MPYIAHTSKDGREQSIADHSYATAEYATNLCIEELKDIVCAAGLLHDIGKYQDAFVRRIHGEDIRVEHAMCGIAGGRTAVCR